MIRLSRPVALCFLVICMAILEGGQGFQELRPRQVPRTPAFVVGTSIHSIRGTGADTCCARNRVQCAGIRMVVNDVEEQASILSDSAESSVAKAMKATDYYKPLVEGDILESTDEQRIIVAVAFALLAGLAGKGVYLMDSTNASPWGMCAAALVGFEFADFGSGVYHWAMDNYGNKNTPIFGTQIEAFQGHHELPWTITYRQVCNNIYKICQSTTPFVVAALAVVNNPYILMWMSTAIAFINASQELHKWSHMSASECHPVVNMLQDANVIIGRKPHLSHHRPPFDGNYCIVSGHCNPVLDATNFFRGLEKTVFAINGAQARCWTNERLLQDTVESLGIKRSTKTVQRP